MVIIQRLSHNANYPKGCLRGDCAFYDEVERIVPCGADGYVLGHAKRHCDRFDARIDTFNNKVWNTPSMVYMGHLLEILTLSRFEHSQLDTLQMPGLLYRPL